MASAVHLILGSDFLIFFDLCLHVRHCHLIRESTLLIVNDIRSPGPSLGIRTFLPAMLFEHLLSGFPALTRPRLLAAAVSHEVEHHSDTTEPPVFA